MMRRQRVVPPLQGVVVPTAAMTYSAAAAPTPAIYVGVRLLVVRRRNIPRMVRCGTGSHLAKVRPPYGEVKSRDNCLAGSGSKCHRDI